MTDYISRQAAIDILDETWVDGTEYMGDLHKDFNAIPAADVVEVVRCKDCKHRIYDKERDIYYCEMYYGLGSVRDNNYCSFGER